MLCVRPAAPEVDSLGIVGFEGPAEASKGLGPRGDIDINELRQLRLVRFPIIIHPLSLYLLTFVPSAQKWRGRGGASSYAPIGYLNSGKTVGGVEVNAGRERQEALPAGDY
jgi:hypothetical protein